SVWIRVTVRVMSVYFLTLSIPKNSLSIGRKVYSTISSLESFVHSIVNTFEMSTLAIYDTTVVISHFYRKVIVDFAIVVPITVSTRTCSLDGYRRLLFGAVSDLTIVAVSLNNVIST